MTDHAIELIEAERRGRQLGRRQADVDNYEARRILRMTTNALAYALDLIRSGRVVQDYELQILEEAEARSRTLVK